MATIQEIKDANREELDAMLVEQGLDPAAEEHSNVKKARNALFALASDAEENDTEDVEGDTEVETDEETGVDHKPSVEAVNEGEKVAQTASIPKKDTKAVAPVGHASSFDKFGQPIFGKAK